MDAEHSFLGLTVDDPLAGLSAGFELRFKAFHADVSEQALLAAHKDWALLNGTMLSVGFGNFEHTKVLGSAVMVAPGIALCAWHVLEEGLPAQGEATDWLMCMAVAGTSLRIWGVQTYTRVGTTDLVILDLRLKTAIQEDDSFHQAVVTARIPAVGELVTVIGTTAASEKFHDALGDTPETAAPMDLALHIAKGSVTQRYLPQRDSALLPWPCIEIDCPAQGGMSGGPVFDQAGALVGVVCSSVQTEDGTGPTYASLLYPALISVYEGGWPQDLFPGKQMLLKNTYCIIQGREAFVPIVETMVVGETSSYTFNYS